MADKKISALTAATTPLAGTEVLPIVQSGSTVKVANNDLRPKQIQSNATSGVLQVVGPAAAATRVMTTPDANFTVARTDTGQTFTGDQQVTGSLGIGVAPSQRLTVGGSADAQMTLVSNTTTGSSEIYMGDADSVFRGLISYAHTTDSMSIYTAATKAIGIDSSQNVSMTAGNLIQGTAAKGVNFTANTPAAGMTSQLLNWYEEGTWTPVLSDGTNNATMATAAAAYTRIGNLVTVWAWIETSSLGSVTGNISITGLPFTVKNDNAAYGSAGVVANAYNLNITAGQTVTVRANPNATTLNVYLWDATTGSTNMQASEWSADGGAQFSCTYRAA